MKTLLKKTTDSGHEIESQDDIAHYLNITPVRKWINCTGDVVLGDTIQFSEAVFGGSFKKPKYRGDRTIIAEVLGESYGAEKQQHTFSLEIIESDGLDPLITGTKTTRKGRNIYRNGTQRLIWPNESERGVVADEKHARGDYHRSLRAERESKYAS